MVHRISPSKETMLLLFQPGGIGFFAVPSSPTAEVDTEDKFNLMDSRRLPALLMSNLGYQVTCHRYYYMFSSYITENLMDFHPFYLMKLVIYS